jgi:hypothetical protein
MSSPATSVHSQAPRDGAACAKQVDRSMVGLGFATPQHVARKLQRHLATVYRMVKSGDLRSKRALGRTYIEISSVVEWAGLLGADAAGLHDWSDCCS